MPTDTLADAHHEAGHAVIARGLGIEVTSMALDKVRTRCPCNDAMTSWAGAVIALSGPMAEIRHGGMSPEEIERKWTTQWATDRSNAERHLQDIDEALHQTGVTPMAEVEELARRWVDQHWATITRVAEALNEQRELAPFELERLRRGQ
jgi:hypothetical protein